MKLADFLENVFYEVDAPILFLKLWTLSISKCIWAPSQCQNYSLHIFHIEIIFLGGKGIVNIVLIGKFSRDSGLLCINLVRRNF